MIQIIGAGAIGCLWLAKLQQAGFTCHLVSRSQHTTSTLTFKDHQGVVHKQPISHSHHPLSTTSTEQNSLILVCVKAQQIVNALLMQQAFISNQQPIVLMHNGYGCAEQVLEHFPENPIICATTANASLVNGPLNITHTGMGPSFFGPFNAKAAHQKECVSPFLEAMQDTRWSDDIMTKCWLKLIINAVINPLTAIHNIKNRQLEKPQYKELIEALILEAYAISKAEQLYFTPSFLLQTVINVIDATAENFSSMNRDIFYYRETEIDFINGYLIKKAQQHNIATPILSDLYQQIKALEHRSPAVADTQ